MIWLIAQTWFWMVVAFGFGVLAAWLIAVIAWPREDELAAALEAEDAPAELEGELDTAFVADEDDTVEMDVTDVAGEEKR
ncbi:hypothetical protein ACMYYO_00870 [Dermacoccaceae bacterium W4C1]